MKPLFLLTLLVLATTCNQLQAQIKLPIFEEDASNLQRVAFQPAATRSDFQHGKLLRITMNGDMGASVKGILVRVDHKNKRIYLRTDPGLPPKMIALAEIKSVDKVVIREVNFQGDVAAPEIQRLEIINGSRRTVSFSAPTLSPGERTQLTELEQAENELERLEYLANVDSQDVLANRLGALQLERQQMLNDLLRQHLMANVSYANPVYMGTRLGMLPLPLPLEFWFESLNGNPTLGKAPAPNGQDSVTVKSKTEGAGAASTARRDFATLQNRAVYENGRLVAVIIDDRDN